MKRYLLFICVLSLVFLSACRPGEAEDGAPPEPEGPIRLESLSVEVPRADLSAGELSRSVRELPEDLKAALAAREVEVETVTVSVGSSPEATAQAVSEGGVDLAFFAGEDFAALETPLPPLLTAGGGEGDEPCVMAAAVRTGSETLAGEAFAQALSEAVNSLEEDYPVFGAASYAPAEGD